ncbi:MAG: arsenite methyltransferase [Planctomycetota bacterium]|jgi:SAM-dependent methyltransferase
MDDLRKAVRETYGKIAANARESGTGCGPRSCCSQSTDLGYTESDEAGVPEAANLGLGCGNPLAIAALKPGETVLDLGSGGGFDSFLAAKRVGETGRVIGVDMTPEMVTLARENAAKDGITNVEFRLGEIESLPVANGTVDVILSNCVINLSTDKRAVIHEAFRVLKPGGRLAITDIVATKPLPEEIRGNVALHVGCTAGAATIDEQVAMLRATGFEDVRIRPLGGSRDLIGEWIPEIELEEHLVSATIEARKP